MILMMMAALAVNNPDVVLGRWQTETKHGVIDIARCGPSICGKLTGSDGLKANPNLLDTNNKEAGLRSRKLMGLQLLGGFTYADGVWSGGTIYNGEDGGTYKATVTPIDADHLKLKGCIIWPLCKTQTWTRLR